MANKKLGFIKLYRSLLDHWLWNINTPFDERSAWVDLLLLANHEDKKTPYNKGFRLIHRGQHLTSQLKLANRWHWTRKRVKKFLKLLKSDGLIFFDSTTNDTLITIVNYDNFQGQGTTKGTTNDPTNDTASNPTEGTADDPQTRNIKNDKEIEEMKEKERPPAPGEGYVWNEYVGRWVAPPKDGGTWQ